MCFLQKTVVFMLIAHSLLAQSYKIQGRIVGLQNSSCYLGHYWGNAQTIIYKDTAQINADGIFEFSGEKPLPEGNYVVRLPNKTQLELIIPNQQNFSFITQSTDLINSMQVFNSADNEKIYQYLKFLTAQYANMQKMPNGQKMQYQQAINLYKKALFEDKSLLASKIVRGGDDVEILNQPTLSNGKADSVALFYYYKNHFFDNLDLSDDRLIRTSFFEQKISTYLQNLTYQLPDSLIKSIDFLMNQTKGNPTVLKYIASKVTSLYENPKAVELEGVFVHTFEKYYKPNAQLWDETVIKNLSKRTNTLKPLILGSVIPNITATDLQGKEVSLHDINSKYTILYIYSLTCNHCKEHAPKVAALQRKLLPRGVKFYTIPVERNTTQWKSFINTYHTESLLNVIDSKNNVDFVSRFNVTEYPTIFILDKDKKIIGKRINPALIEKYLDYVEQK